MRAAITGRAGMAKWLAICLLAFGADAPAVSISIAWDMPTGNTDGTPLTDLAGSKLYYGSASRSYTEVIDAGTSTSTVVSGLEDGLTYYFAITAYNTTSNESAFSAELVWTCVEPPTVTSVVARFNPTLIQVHLSEPVKAAEAGDPARYTLDGGIAVASAALEAGGRTILLRTTSAMTDGQTYTLRLNDIADIGGTAIDPANACTFRFEADVATGLAACWRLDDGAGTTAADDRHVADGALVGGAAWAAGRQGTAVRFDGADDYIAAGRSDPATGDMTVCAWLLWSGGSGSAQTIAAKRDARTDAGMRWSAGLTAAGQVRFEGPLSGTTFAYTPPVGQWVHLAIVKSGTLATLYVNGTPAGSGPASFGSGSNALLTIGGLAGAAATFNGSIDEARIYSRAVTGDEIRQVAALTGGGGDLDGDGIADQWTLACFGAESEAGGGASDPDGDGVANVAEFIAGTDPLDPGSAPTLLIGLADGSPRVSFTAYAAAGAGYQGRSRYYSLEQQDLSSGSAWQTVSGMSRIPATGQMVYHAGQGGLAYRTRISLE
jgi:hypothetical protein